MSEVVGQEAANATTMKDDLEALSEFSTQNDELRSLERRIGKFNIFHALRIERAEIRHSNFLGWILDPNASHEQGSIFLMAVLVDVLGRMPQDCRPYDPIILQNIDLQGVNVLRERENIDLLITANEPSIALVIENKTDSGEHSDQLQRYAAAVETLHPEHKAIFVLLSIDGVEASDSRYLSYSYRDIHRIISACLSSTTVNLAPDVRVFIDHYLHLLESRFMQDPQVAQLLSVIYQNHRRAVDLLIEKFGKTKSGLVDDFNEMLRADPGRWHVFKNTSRHIDFVPKGWLNWVPPYGISDDGDPQTWLVWQILIDNNRLVLLVKVGACKDKAVRRNFIARVVTVSSLCLEETGKKGDGYCKLYRNLITTWKEGCEPTFDSLRDEVQRILGNLERQLVPLPQVFNEIIAPA